MWLPTALIDIRAGIPNQTSRERTTPLYLEKAAFRHALDMEDEDHIFIILVDPAGNVLFRARGAFTPEAGEQIGEAVKQFFARQGE